MRTSQVLIVISAVFIASAINSLPIRSKYVVNVVFAIFFLIAGYLSMRSELYAGRLP